MTTSIHRRRFPRAATLAVAVTIIGSAGLGWHALRASAAFPGAPYQTQFEIDGNLAVDSTQDWASLPASAPNLQGAPFEATEVCDKNPAIVDGQEVTEDPTRVVPGTKIDQILIAAPPVGGNNVPKKTDLCSVYRSWELVFVPTADPNDDADAGQYDFVLYGAWSRPDVNGEIDVLFPLLGSVANSNTDDLVISYDFNDSTNATEVDVLQWNGSSWVSKGLPESAFDATTTSGEVVHAVTGAGLTFGEFALNLTAAGILPGDGPCTTFSTGDPISRTGNSTSATLEDIVDATPLNLTNCGSLTINKHTRPVTPAPAQSFGVQTTELDGRVIQSPDTLAINDVLTVPTTPSVTHDNLLTSPDYSVSETGIPAGWTQESLVCTSFDPITGQNVTRTLYSAGDDGPDASFPIAPGRTAVCDVTNVGPPTVSVTKAVDGTGTNWAFQFTIDPVPTGETPTKTATAASPTVTWTLQAGTEYTITEAPVDGFISGTISCGEGGDTFTPDPGDEITCLVTNTELVPLDLVATAAGSYERTLAWSVDKSATPTSLAGTAGQSAGSSTWTVTATKTVTLGNYGVTGTLTITNGNGFAVPVAITTSLSDGTTATVTCPQPTVPADGTLQCTFAAAPSGSTATLATAVVTPTDPILDSQTANTPLSFTAHVIGDETVTVDDDRDTDGQFPTAISATTTFNYDETFPCSSNPADYTNLVDTDTYPNTATLTGDVTHLSDSAAVTVRCDLPPASVDVTKTVTGSAATWSFDFTISPVPAGETATKSATNAAPTVGWDGLVPGRTYTVTETDKTGFTTGTLICAGGTNATGTSTLTPAAGQAVSCAITNDLVEQQAPPIADVAVVKTATPSTVTPGGNVTWTLVARNNGPDPADTATIVDNLPTTLTLVSFTSPAGWDCSGSATGNPGKLSCSKPTMGVNESATFTLTTTVESAAAGTTINNTAVVSTTTGETTTSNNSDSEPITVQVAVLPPTGADHVRDRLAIAAALLFAGTLLMTVNRRRRNDSN